MRWITSQIGAREHYAIPRVLQRAGKLEILYTDFWATAPWRLLGKLSGKSSLATRYHPDLKDARVRGFNLQTLKTSRVQFSNPYEGFLAVGRQFGEQVVSDLEKQSRDEGYGNAEKSSRRSTLDARLGACLFWLRHGVSGAGPMGEGSWREVDHLSDGSCALRGRSRQGGGEEVAGLGQAIGRSPGGLLQTP